MMKALWISFILLIIIFLITVIAIIGRNVCESLDIILCFGTRKHNPTHPGITEKTIFGKWDIFCPKCRCLYCNYVYVYKGVLINPFEKDNSKIEKSKRFTQYIKELINEQDKLYNTEEKYKCSECGYIFK